MRRVLRGSLTPYVDPRQLELCLLLQWHFDISGHESRLNIKIPPYKYRDFYHKDKTVSQPSYLYNGNIHTWKTVFILKRGSGSRHFSPKLLSADGHQCVSLFCCCCCCCCCCFVYQVQSVAYVLPLQIHRVLTFMLATLCKTRNIFILSHITGDSGVKGFNEYLPDFFSEILIYICSISRYFLQNTHTSGRNIGCSLWIQIHWLCRACDDIIFDRVVVKRRYIIAISLVISRWMPSSLCWHKWDRTKMDTVPRRIEIQSISIQRFLLSRIWGRTFLNAFSG